MKVYKSYGNALYDVKISRGREKLYFIKLSTFPLELQLGIRVDSDTDTKDGAYVIDAVENYRRLIYLDEYMLQTQNHCLI